MGGAITGDGEGTEEVERNGIGIHPVEVPSDFSAAVAPMSMNSPFLHV